MIHAVDASAMIAAGPGPKHPTKRFHPRFQLRREPTTETETGIARIETPGPRTRAAGSVRSWPPRSVGNASPLWRGTRGRARS